MVGDCTKNGAERNLGLITNYTVIAGNYVEAIGVWVLLAQLVELFAVLTDCKLT